MLQQHNYRKLSPAQGFPWCVAASLRVWRAQLGVVGIYATATRHEGIPPRTEDKNVHGYPEPDDPEAERGLPRTVARE